jgi:hypothetical protein
MGFPPPRVNIGAIAFCDWLLSGDHLFLGDHLLLGVHLLLGDRPLVGLSLFFEQIHTLEVLRAPPLHFRLATTSLRGPLNRHVLLHEMEIHRKYEDVFAIELSKELSRSSNPRTLIADELVQRAVTAKR